MNLTLFIPEITLAVFAILVILLDLGVRQKSVLMAVSLAGLVIAGGFSFLHNIERCGTGAIGIDVGFHLPYIL